MENTMKDKQLIVTLRRHGEKLVVNGRALDELSEGAYAAAKDLGQQMYGNKFLITRHSQTRRARSTCEAFLEGAGKDVEEARRSKLISPSDHLDDSRISKKYEREMIDGIGYDASYDEMTTWIQDHPFDEDMGRNHVFEAGNQLRRFVTLMYFCEFELDGRDSSQYDTVYVEGISHCGKLDMGLINFLNLAGEDVHRVEDIGGTIPELGNFHVRVDTTVKDNRLIQLVNKEVEYDLPDDFLQLQYYR